VPDAPPSLLRETFPSPIGAHHVVTRGDAVCVVAFDPGAGAWVGAHLGRWFPGETAHDGRGPATVRRAFDAYFDGDLRALDALETDARGTPFQQSVWRALRTIPAGRTETYGAVARRIGRPAAVRAVGLANGKNPTPVIVPCHRVIGADGKLTGFGGGLDKKAWLLHHESVSGAIPFGERAP
jgi:methylated-DNA-[protein]-cysteine S-methyltransferase